MRSGSNRTRRTPISSNRRRSNTHRRRRLRPPRKRTIRRRSFRTWRSSTARVCSPMRSSQPPRPRSSDFELSRVEAYSRLAGVYDEIVVDPCHGSWASYLHALWGADPDGVGSVLDLCCGTGLLAAELGLLGYRVVGIDASDAMLL